MTNTMTRSLIEAIVRSKLEALKKSPERNTRNLIDMALHFSTSRFQKHFFEIAQEMLKNENSLYYQLVHHAVSDIDNEQLLGFGMNVGYNSFTYGAKVIRKIESQSNFNIPWCVTLTLDAKTSHSNPEHYHQMLNEGKALGIYTWHILSNGQLEEFFPIMKMNTDCAFFLFCKPSEITEQLLETLNSLNNIMYVIEYSENSFDIFSELQKRNRLYSTYFQYSDKDVPDICSNEFLCAATETNALFAILFASPDCSLNAKEIVCNYVWETRKSPIYKTLPFEFAYDIQRIDSIISDDSCSARFDINGNLQSTITSNSQPNSLNHFHFGLSDIFKRAFPKL